jgi:hypothetical protein
VDTIHVTRIVTVSTSARLTIEAGTVIRFDSGAGLFVLGRLTAAGTKDKHILFTTIADTVGGLPTAGQWVGLNFLPGSSGDLNYCDVRFADNGVIVERASVTFRGCIIEDFALRGIYLKGATAAQPISTTIADCIIRQNDAGTKGNGTGVYVYRAVNVTLTQCEISDCQYGIQFKGNEADAPRFTITGCTIRDNAAYGIYIPWSG